jgi:outer membrane receptor for ferrienterochelin and colicin
MGNGFKTKGIELSISSYLFSSITLNGGLITTGHTRMDDPGNYIYSTDLSLSASYNCQRYNYEFAVFYKYTDDYLEFAGNFDAAGELDGVAQRFINGYNTLDITFSKYLFQHRLVISAGIKNLFDITLVNSFGNLNFHGSDSNETAIGYGRTYFVKLGYQFEK